MSSGFGCLQMDTVLQVSGLQVSPGFGLLSNWRFLQVSSNFLQCPLSRPKTPGHWALSVLFGLVSVLSSGWECPPNVQRIWLVSSRFLQRPPGWEDSVLQLSKCPVSRAVQDNKSPDRKVSSGAIQLSMLSDNGLYLSFWSPLSVRTRIWSSRFPGPPGF